MEFDAILSSAVSALSAGAVCAAMTAGRMRRNVFLLMLLTLLVSAVGVWNKTAVYPAAAVVMALVLYASEAKPADAASAAFAAAGTAFLILFFVNGMVAPTLEAYSYTLRYDFYYAGVHSPVVMASAAVIMAAMIIMIKLLPSDSRMSGAVPICVISLSLAAAAVMILHMLFGRLIEFNAKYFRIPLPYSMLTGAIALLCCAFTCIFIRVLSSKLVLSEKLSQTKEFYLILTAIILMIVFYCCENIILNNYTSFDEPEYKYITTMLIVLMLITILTALIAVCSYILRTRAYQSKLERDMEITEMYRNEIKDIQQNIFDFKHDYMKLYSSMSYYLINKEYDRLEEFFNSNITPLQEDLFSLDEEAAAIRMLEDNAVQGLIYSYIIKAKKAGVSLLVDIRENVPVLSVPVMDLNRMLGIFLDNAIEQAQTQDKKVGFAAITEEDSVIFIISNAADKVDIEKMFKRGASSKGTDRGRGLAIARKLCASHDEMSMHTYMKNGSFVCELYVSEEKFGKR
ncbi:MAG: GHKL domain-containing protein [bacterium]|nr:GHKL domain-containing protein [bacterium]